MQIKSGLILTCTHALDPDPEFWIVSQQFCGGRASVCSKVDSVGGWVVGGDLQMGGNRKGFGLTPTGLNWGFGRMEGYTLYIQHNGSPNRDLSARTTIRGADRNLFLTVGKVRKNRIVAFYLNYFCQLIVLQIRIGMKLFLPTSE